MRTALRRFQSKAANVFNSGCGRTRQRGGILSEWKTYLSENKIELDTTILMTDVRQSPCTGVFGQVNGMVANG